VHGRGVFATAPIRKGARIIEYTGRRILWSTIPEDLADARTYYFGLDDETKVIDPTVGGNEARWINHSCDPNCEAIENSRGRVFIEALRNIRTGEELFYDYRLVIDVPRTKEIEQESICHCGSTRCRGNMLDLTSDL
jgi:SET domain-containing protein